MGGRPEAQRGVRCHQPVSVTPSDWLRVSDLRWLPEVNVEAAGGLLEDSQFLDVGKREGEWQGDKWN